MCGSEEEGEDHHDVDSDDDLSDAASRGIDEEVWKWRNSEPFSVRSWEHAGELNLFWASSRWRALWTSSQPSPTRSTMTSP